MRQRGLIRAEWGQTPNNQRARYYTITAAGKKQLGAQHSGFRRSYRRRDRSRHEGKLGSRETTMRELFMRLLDLFRRDKLDAELKDELAFHHTMLERDERVAGAAPDAAAHLPIAASATSPASESVHVTRGASRGSRSSSRICAMRCEDCAAHRASPRRSSSRLALASARTPPCSA